MDNEFPALVDIDVAKVFHELIQGSGANAQARSAILEEFGRGLSQLEQIQACSLAAMQAKALEIFEQSCQRHLHDEGLFGMLFHGIFGGAAQVAERRARETTRGVMQDVLEVQEQFVKHALERRLALLKQLAALEAKNEESVEEALQKSLPGLSLKGLPRIKLEKMADMPDGVFEDRF